MRAMAMSVGLPWVLLLSGCAQSTPKQAATAADPAVFAPLPQAAVPQAAVPQAALPAPPRAKPAPERTPQLAAKVAAIRARQARLHSYRAEMAAGGSWMTVWVSQSDGTAKHIKLLTNATSWMLYDPVARCIYSVTGQPRQVFRRTLGENFRMPATLTATIAPLLDAAASITDETIYSTPCHKVVVGDGPQTQITLWLDREHGLPRRLVAGDLEVSFVCGQVNAVPDSEFALPAGMKPIEATGSGPFGSGPIPFAVPPMTSAPMMASPPR